MALKYNERYVLVPEELINPELMEEQTGSGKDPVVEKVMSDLDSEMKRILASDLGMSSKLKLYQDLLAKYQHMKKQVDVPDIVAMEPQSQPIPEPAEILKGLTQKQKNSGKLILQHIAKNPRISYNNKGELQIDGNRVPLTSIKDLIDDATNINKNAPEVGPQGYKDFLTVLAETGLPEKAITNPNRRAFAYREPVVENGPETETTSARDRDSDVPRARKGKGKRKRDSETEDSDQWQSASPTSKSKTAKRKLLKSSATPATSIKSIRKSLNWSSYPTN